MRRKTFVAATALAFAVSFSACSVRQETSHLEEGAHGATSPAESGNHGAVAYVPDPQDTYKTAGLLPEYTNAKVDPTMEGSGNIAWQGSYEKEKRAQQTATQPAAAQPAANAPKPAAAPKSS